ncbi:glycosyltransferase family 4 protein [Candidatus Woesearchaeota archaeon]|nr:glycosyltransferase family 4 protein [Candidatus Woesearchaeota archaeon]
MRILYVLSKAVPNTGNYITAHRIAQLLEQKKHVVKIMSFQDDVTPEKTILSFKPDIIHTFHAYYGYDVIVLASKFKIPLVLTITGTDVNSDLQKPERRGKVLYCLKHAKTITIFHQDMKRFLPKSIKNIVVVPQSVHLRKCKKVCDNSFRILLVSNIRPVKNNLFPIKPCESLRKQIPNLKLHFVGKVLDQEYFKKFKQITTGKRWITYYGEVPHHEIYRYYTCVDVALNTSLSEGGMANTLLEAMYLKIPVIASSITGNKTIVKNHKTGLLYADENGFKKALLCLYHNPQLKEKLTGAAYEQVINQFSPQKECEGYLGVYNQLIT